jgi:Zn finger protein HypA/HybF involved in hydrogenase expression
MILKELDPYIAEDKYEAAGRKAEEQMAFYLRRFFGKSSEVDVLNGIRIELGGEIAQMDHLVLHPYGFLIVESKSVSGSVQIMDDGQWMRWYLKQPKPIGMRSPVTQAKMQCQLLTELLETGVKQKGFFSKVNFDVLVAISDGGTIQWPKSGVLKEVCKADQVAEKVTKRIESIQSLNGCINHTLTQEHRQRITDFLIRMHKPVVVDTPTETAATKPVPVSPPVEKSKPVANQLPAASCKHCHSNAVELTYGKFGYYFQCKSCAKNTPLRFDCPVCGGEGRIRKDGKNFFAECRACSVSVPYFTNP